MAPSEERRSVYVRMSVIFVIRHFDGFPLRIINGHSSQTKLILDAIHFLSLRDTYNFSRITYFALTQGEFLNNSEKTFFLEKRPPEYEINKKVIFFLANFRAISFEGGAMQKSRANMEKFVCKTVM